jgi:DNA-binding LacI/PurR family transcriptional regulator
MTVTLREVAQLAGVSFKTVSNVVNGYAHVSQPTRERVLAAVDELGYRPNRSARTLRSGKTGAIGLAVPELSLAYFAELADEVIKVADEHGWVVLIETTGGERSKEIEVLDSDRRQMTDGLLYSPLALGNSDADKVDVEYPLVLLGERIFNSRADHVVMQNVEAAQAATELLIDRGCRRIAALGAHRGEDIGSAGLRLKGYRAALASHDIPFDESLVVDAGPWHRVNGADGMRDLLDRGVPFDGVFAMNDELGFGALRVLGEQGITIPGEVQVIGFDDVDEGRFSLPSLTSVDPGRRQIARLAVEMLIDRIERTRLGEKVERRQRQSDFVIVERESTIVSDS